MNVVAWEILEHRIYGAPGEKYRRVLWVEDYTLDDGTCPDLDWMLEEAHREAAGLEPLYERLEGFIPTRKVLRVRPLYSDSPTSTPRPG